MIIALPIKSEQFLSFHLACQEGLLSIIFEHGSLEN